MALTDNERKTIESFHRKVWTPDVFAAWSFDKAWPHFKLAEEKREEASRYWSKLEEHADNYPPEGSYVATMDDLDEPEPVELFDMFNNAPNWKPMS